MPRGRIGILLFACLLPLAAQQPSPGEDGQANYDAVLAKVDGWIRQHPALVRRVAIGTSAAGRSLFVVRIGTETADAPEVFVGGGIHGHEGSEADAVWMVDRLLTQREDPAIAQLLASRVLWVQPLINPDGVVAQRRHNDRGVDLNRNFDGRWEQRGKPWSHSCSGPAAFSEPESRAVRDFVRGREHLRAFLDLHRSVDILVAAQTGTAGGVDDVVQAAAEALLAAIGNGQSSSHSLHHFPAMHGLGIDWVHGELGVVAFALENRGQFAKASAVPPEDDPRWRCLRHLLDHAAEYPPRRAALEAAAAPYPVLVTDRTRADAAELARLTTPGRVLFADDFETEAAFASYFEIGGLPEGRVQIVHDRELVHRGSGALQLTSTASAGRSCGASPQLWLGDDGFDCVHLRYWIRYADDYDQGNLNHTGGSLSAVAGTNKWAGMGSAGLKPLGDDHFDVRVEGWRDWQRVAAPGYLFCYAYWMDMRQDRDGHFWGNMLGPAESERVVPARGKWLCVEQRLQVNTPGKDDGELAVWLDGTLYLHYRGCRWRSSDAVRIKRASLLVYVHEARRDNRVCFDDLVVSTGYVGPDALALPPNK